MNVSGYAGWLATTVPQQRLASKVRVFPDDHDRFSVMPQGGNGLQPRVAGSATLGDERNFVFNRNAVVPAGCIFLRENDATALRLNIFLLVSQGSLSGNPGL